MARPRTYSLVSTGVLSADGIQIFPSTTLRFRRQARRGRDLFGTVVKRHTIPGRAGCRLVNMLVEPRMGGRHILTFDFAFALEASRTFS